MIQIPVVVEASNISSNIGEFGFEYGSYRDINLNYFSLCDVDSPSSGIPTLCFYHLE